MPRRNHPKPIRRKRHEDTTTEESEQGSYQQLAHDLVNRGLASRQILGAVPYGRRQRMKDET